MYYFGLIREVTRQPWTTVGAPDGAALTVRGICDELCRRYGEPMRFELFRGSVLSLYVRVHVDGRDITALDGLETEVGAGSRVDILSFAAFSGG